MRITFFHYIYGSFGPLVQVKEFAEAFRKLGHEMTVHPMEEVSEGGGSSRRILKRGLSRFFHEMNSLGKNLKHFQAEARIVSREQPEAILTRYKLYDISSAWVARRFRIPLVLWVHSPAAFEQREYLREFLRVPGLAERVEGQFIRAADRVLVVSEELKRYFLGPAAGVHGERLEVIPNGVNPEKFTPSIDGQPVRSQFPCPEPVVLGFVGSFSAWHGMKSLKSLMTFALSEYPNTCFLLVGEGPHRGQIESFVRSGGWDPRRVLFTGQADHSGIPRYLSATDICLLPYDQEKEKFYFSPLKLFEYLACGKPVFASRRGQIEEVIQDGHNGVLYSPENPEEALSRLRTLIEDAAFRKKLGEAARRTVLDRYTWRHAALAVERILTGALNQSRFSS